jgi:hypothetical protein
MSVFTWMPWYFAPLMLLGLVLPIIVLVRWLRGSVERSRILASGIPAQATIMRIWETGLRVNGRPQVGFQLHVHPPQGLAPYVAEASMVISELMIPRIQPGATIPIKLDPADPRKVALDLGM